MTLGSRIKRLAALTLATVLAAGPALAAKAPFDLAGPMLKVTVTRGALTLPIAETPDLAAGDSLSLKSDMPPGQATQYLLVVAFLRGATNPPPKTWFFGLKTWEHGGRDELKVRVPDGAQQAVIFLAPRTVGDFDTLRNAVRGRPGAFVRASQDLNQLGLDRGRLNVYLDAVRATQRDNPTRLQAVSTDLARTLGIKLDTSCFQKSPELQAPCLMQDQESLVLDDGESTSLVKSLSTGATADLMTQLGSAPQMGAGAYSPYVGAVLDIARLLDSLGTAHFQYVPALAALRGDQLQLRLNTAPSFGAVKSVLVAPLPPVEPVQSPPLHAGDADIACLEAPDTVLRVDGAPLVFSTGYARNLSLRLKAKSGQSFDVPLRADATRGGFRLDTSTVNPSDFDSNLEGRLHGSWGFADFEGPLFHFETGQTGAWRLNAADKDDLVVGHDAHARLTGGASACVKSITLAQPGAADRPLSFKTAGPHDLDITVALAHGAPGPLTLKIQSFGVAAPDSLATEAFAPASRIDGFVFHAGDKTGELTGAGLGSVARLTLGGATFTPRPAEVAGGDDEHATLMSPDDRGLETLASGRKLIAKVDLQDGRTLTLPVTILPPRPAVTLLAQSLRLPSPAPGVLALSLSDPRTIPRGGVLTFSIQARAPAAISPNDSLEVATADDAFSTTLAPGAGLTREDAHLAVAVLDTTRAFGPSAFGPLRFRLVNSRGDSDWQDLGVLVRLPTLTGLKCPAEPQGPCALSGERLFLLQSVAGHADFEDAAVTPDGYPGEVLEVPRPHAGRLYIRLHDDPTAIAIAVVGAHRLKGSPSVTAVSPAPDAPSAVTGAGITTPRTPTTRY